jgi:hypothetical protein
MALHRDDVPHGARSHGAHRIAHLSAPAEYVVDSQRQLVIVKFGTKLTVGSVEQYAVTLRADRSFRPGFSEIADLSKVQEVDLQADEFIKLADQIDPFSPDAKRAFVARNSVQKHAARMHKILRSQRNIEIFDTLEKAIQWIQS